jgi:hypothetical protein
MSGERLATLRKFAASRFIFSIEGRNFYRATCRPCGKVARAPATTPKPLRVCTENQILQYW